MDDGFLQNRTVSRLNVMAQILHFDDQGGFLWPKAAWEQQRCWKCDGLPLTGEETSMLLWNCLSSVSQDTCSRVFSLLK